MDTMLILMILVICIIIIDIYTTWPSLSKLTPFLIPPTCVWYQFDPAEWTLNIKNSSCHQTGEEYSDIPKDFFKGKVIKRVIHPNGTIENQGCTRHTEKCKEQPHFDYLLNARINTPPCCRQHILDTLNHVTTELQNLNISHFLAYGSVIGWVRYKDMIPNDRDFDLIVDGEFYHSERFDQFLAMLAEKYGHYYQTMEVLHDNGKQLKMKVTVFTSIMNRNGGDIWPYDLDEENDEIVIQMKKYHYFATNQPYEYIFPLKHVLFHGFSTFIPNKHIEYLDIQYGKSTYMKELTCKEVSDGMCVS